MHNSNSMAGDDDDNKVFSVHYMASNLKSLRVNLTLFNNECECGYVCVLNARDM